MQSQRPVRVGRDSTPVSIDQADDPEERAKAIAWDAELRPGEKVEYRQEMEYDGDREDGPETVLVEMVEAY